MKFCFRFTPVKLLVTSVMMFVFISLASCYAQQSVFNVKPIPDKYKISPADLTTYKQQAAAAQKGAYDLTKSLPQGYLTDGSVDYTKFIQQGINTNSDVAFPNFPVLINKAGISLKSNSTVIFPENSKLILSPSDAANYQILRIFNVQNITVYFPVLIGDRKNHIGTKGEWGMGISITGASNVEIINPKISECWGDGIYLGRMTSSSRNIKISYAELNDNRRNGISIVSVDGLILTHPLVCNTNGTDPMAGLDFEPNGNADVLKNIVVDNPVTFNNAKIGMAISIWGMQGKVDNDVDIIIKNHIDDHSENAFLYYGFRNDSENNNLNGHIQIINPSWKNNKVIFKRSGYSQRGPNVDFKNVSISKNVSGRDIDQSDSVKKIKESYTDAKVNFH